MLLACFEFHAAYVAPNATFFTCPKALLKLILSSSVKGSQVKTNRNLHNIFMLYERRC